MMWIRLSSDQTVEIELFGTLEGEENSQFSSDTSSLLLLAQLSLKGEGNNLN